MKFEPITLLRTRRDLINALKEEKLPRSTPWLNQFEDAGIIDFPQHGCKRNNNGFDRLYTESEIKEVVKSIKKYLHNKKQFVNKK
jgi:hypothetical protein